ncbi:CPBP family intramembrane metalloprotease domain-containing protein [Brevibacterium ravenspurgense]|uniref:CPBP family intramembrane metalloprotease domain-containing protein n=1 Tax=Brevibacterium ravenspurgense TaxID=479117 RepID=A0A2I1IIM4_9MICO|nr:CPBP family intramembrane glutamic endopeptidase [Brevibacterium ravenspurgense]PKY70984.1 CPBP family intramembrane metalloprotease domain-containing protein [Brevibacterium ravenspurgense]
MISSEVSGASYPARLTSPARWRAEVLLVAGVSLGQSAVYAVVRLADMLTRAPLKDSTAGLNHSQSTREVFDLVYQLLGIGFTLVPVALALYLMWLDGQGSVLERLGLGRGVGRGGAGPDAGCGVDPDAGRGAGPDAGCDARGGGTASDGVLRDGARRAAWGDAWRAVGLFVLIGAGTLVVYAAGRALGVTAQISTNNLNAAWWTVPVLLLQAVKNGVLEEVLLLGFFWDRLEKLRWSPWAIIVGLAVFRGSYHLYQGFGPFVGNVLMGLIFGWLYMRRRRVMPFVGAHFLLDAVGFLVPGILRG